MPNTVPAADTPTRLMDYADALALAKAFTRKNPQLHCRARRLRPSRDQRRHRRDRELGVRRDQEMRRFAEGRQPEMILARILYWRWRL
jgi:hypothetical protein